MLTLAIDTASSITSIAVLNGRKVVSEKNWESKKDEAEKLMPGIIKLVPDIKKINKIIVVNGPGSFTGLRVGVSVANILAYLLNAELFAIGTFEIWKKRCATKGAVQLIKAGRSEVFANGKLALIDKVKAKKVYGDLLLEQKKILKKNGVTFVTDIKSFGQAVASISKFKKVKLVEPNYKRSPQITISKNKWKKVAK